MLSKGSQVLSAIHIPQVWVISYMYTFTPHLGDLTCIHIPQVWVISYVHTFTPHLVETGCFEQKSPKFG